MSLRAKTVITALCALIVIVGLVCVLSQLFLIKQFVQLERQYAISYIHRALIALEDRLEALDVTVNDWASWDDTYTFVQDGDEHYVRTNLTESTFATLGINFLVFANRSGEIVFARGFDLERRMATSISDGLAQHLLPSSLLIHHSALESNVRGVLVVQEGVLLVVSRPVLTSEKRGPIQGALVMGMFLDSQMLESLSERGGTNLSMVNIADIDVLLEFKGVLFDEAEGSPIFIKERDSRTISAYALIKDIYSRPALVLKADIPREIYAHARMASGLFLLYILAGGFVFAAIALVFLDRVVLARLTKLSHTAVRIGKEVSLSERLPVSGNDEIGELANTINWMLARIEEGQIALAASEAKYRTILEEMQEGYVELDLSGNIIFCNEAICPMLGYPREQFIGTHWQRYVHSEDIGSVYQSAKQLYESGKPSGLLQCRLVREDKTLRYTEIYLFPRQDENGNTVGFKVLVRDVTERKLLEQQVIATSRLASIGQLAAGMAHEVNNPLTGVIGYAQFLMARTDLPPDVKSDLAKIYNEGQRAAKIVRGLLTFARQDHPKKILVDINDLVKKTVELRSYELKTSGIEVEMNLSSGLPRILADYGQIQQVVLSILVNAEQALTELNHEGKIMVTTGLREGYVTIAISDNGPGIPESISDKVFQPFFTTKEVGKGAGLGLSVCHGIVTAHGGKIYFHSQAGQGTTFFVELPAIGTAIA